MKTLSGAAIFAKIGFKRSANDGPASQSSSSNSEFSSTSALFAEAFSSTFAAATLAFSFVSSLFFPRSALSVFVETATFGAGVGFFASCVELGVATTGRGVGVGVETVGFAGLGVGVETGVKVGVAETGFPKAPLPTLVPVAELAVECAAVGAGVGVFGFSPQLGAEEAEEADGAALASRKTSESTKPLPDFDAEESLDAEPDDAATLGVRSESGLPQFLYGSASGSYFSSSADSSSS